MLRRFQKRFACVLLSAALCAALFSACSVQQEETVSKNTAAATQSAAQTTVTQSAAVSAPSAAANEWAANPPERRRQIAAQYQNSAPALWSEKMPGVVNRFPTQGKELALTLDACGGKYGSQADTELLDFLKAEQIPATLFINRRWIECNEALFLELASNPLFEIENHGYEHRPLCVTPREVYGINGTNSVDKAMDEILLNEDTIFRLTGQKTKFFRSGTAYYDDVAVALAGALGYQIAGFQINGDAGATFTAEQIVTAMNRCQSGDIIISHFNQPQKQTFEGLSQALPMLREQGFSFVKLEDRLCN